MQKGRHRGLARPSVTTHDRSRTSFRAGFLPVVSILLSVSPCQWGNRWDRFAPHRGFKSVNRFHADQQVVVIVRVLPGRLFDHPLGRFKRRDDLRQGQSRVRRVVYVVSWAVPATFRPRVMTRCELMTALASLLGCWMEAIGPGVIRRSA